MIIGIILLAIGIILVLICVVAFLKALFKPEEKAEGGLKDYLEAVNAFNKRALTEFLRPKIIPAALSSVCFALLFFGVFFIPVSVCIFLLSNRSELWIFIRWLSKFLS